MRIGLSLFILLFSTRGLQVGAAQAQVDASSSVMFSIGGVTTTSHDRRARGVALYPEMALRSHLYRNDSAAISLSADLFVGVWSDVARLSFGSQYEVSRGRINAVLGGRSRVRLDRALLPTSIWAGLAYQSTWRDVSDDCRVTPCLAEGVARSWAWKMDMGASVEFSVTSNFKVAPRGSVLIPLPFDEQRVDGTRMMAALGFIYEF